VNELHFLSYSAVLERYLDIGGASVCLSVRPSVRFKLVLTENL